MIRGADGIDRTIKEATVKRHHFDSHHQLRRHFADIMSACDPARRLKTLNFLTPCEQICRIRTSEPVQFTIAPIHQMPVRYT